MILSRRRALTSEFQTPKTLVSDLLFWHLQIGFIYEPWPSQGGRYDVRLCGRRAPQKWAFLTQKALWLQDLIRAIKECRSLFLGYYYSWDSLCLGENKVP